MATPPLSVPITVLAGQSNANSAGIGEALFAQVTAEQGMFVHVAANGTSISPALDTGGGDWSASGAPRSGELLKSLMSQLSAILDPKSPFYVPGAYLEKVVWVQGEADSWLQSAARNYQAELRAIHATMTAKFGQHDLVISALSDAAITGTNTTDSHRNNWATVQAGQIAAAKEDPTIHLVDPDLVAAKAGFSAQQMLMADHIHYSTTTGFAFALGTALGSAGSLSSSAPPQQSQQSNAPHYVSGTFGNDVLSISATGFGQAYGSSGIDTLSLTDRTAGVRVMGAGKDAVRVVANGGESFSLDLVSIENLVLTPFADRVVMAAGLRTVDAGAGNDWISGLASNDTIYLGAGNDLGHSGSGNDILYGGSGSDLMLGGRGSDSLDGGSQDDRLFGGNGMDRLIGGTGNDQLTGGNGRDTFVLYADGSTDKILDFHSRFDHLEIHGATSHVPTVKVDGHDLTLNFGSLSVVLAGIGPADFVSGDFVFM